MEETTEVLYTVSSNSNPFPKELQFIRRGDEYRVVDVKSKGMTRWMSPYEAIKWACIPSILDAYHKMDKFILGYFPEGLVVLVALENA